MKKKSNDSNRYLLAVRSIIIPHQIDQPHPTRQNINVNACATPTIVFTRNDPIRARMLSCCENLGIPKHKQNIPEQMVPASIVDSEQFEVSEWCVHMHNK